MARARAVRRLSVDLVTRLQEGKPVVFEGTAFFTFTGDKIVHYREVFDRCIALVQQDFDAERLKKVLAKTAARINAGAGAQEHLARLARR